MAKIQDKDSGFSIVDQSRLGVNGQALDDLPWLSGCMAWGLTEADESKDDGSYLWWMIAKQNGYHVKVKKDPKKEDSKKIVGFGKAEEFGHMVLSSGLTGPFPDIDNAIKLLKEPADQYNFAINALLDHFRIKHRTRQLAAEFIERTGRSKDSPSEVVNGICDLLHNAFNIGDHSPLDGCEYNIFERRLAGFWNQHSARTRTRDEMTVKDTTSGNELLRSQRLRRDEFDTLVETCRLLGVSWHTVFETSVLIDKELLPLFDLPLASDPGEALFAEWNKHPDLHQSAKRLYEVLLTYATYRGKRKRMTENQRTLSDKNYSPVKQGLEILFKDFGISMDIEKTKTHKRKKGGGDIHRRRTESVCLVNDLADLIDKSLVSVGPGAKVPFIKLEEFKELQSGEISIEPSTTVYQDALEISDFERVKINRYGPTHLLPEVYEELVDIEAISPAITIQEEKVKKLASPDVPKTDAEAALNKKKYKEANQRLCQLEAAKKKAQSATPVQYYHGKMGFGRRYAYTKGSFSYQGASRLVRKILAERYYHDIDIVNCYPVLLWHLLSKNVIDIDIQQKFPILHMAVFKRKEMIEAIMAAFQCEHDIAKRLPSVLMNGGSIHGSKGWCAQNGLNSQHAESTIVDKLYEECQEAILLFAERFPQHKEKSKEMYPNKSLRQHNVAPIHFELERLEDECILSIEQTAQAEGWQIDSLIFDGGLLRKREGFGETEVKSLLLCMQENVKANVGVDIEIAVKPF